jgi:hypothetical protein
MSYNFNIKLHPWGESPERGNVEIDEAALYGAWEYKDGTEGGGLWFERLEDGRLDLTDYDGAFALPKAVTDALRLAGFSVEEIFE